MAEIISFFKIFLAEHPDLLYVAEGGIFSFLFMMIFQCKFEVKMHKSAEERLQIEIDRLRDDLSKREEKIDRLQEKIENLQGQIQDMRLNALDDRSRISFLRQSLHSMLGKRQEDLHRDVQDLLLYLDLNRSRI